MSVYKALVLVVYLGVIQCHEHQSSPDHRPPTTIQLRLPFSYIDGFPLPSYAVPFSSYNKNKRGQIGTNKNLQPTSVKISIPTRTKSGRTTIIIDTRRRPNETPEYNCKPQVKDKTDVNVIVELKNKKGDYGDSASTSTAQSSTTHSKDGELIKSKSSTKSHSKDQDKDVAVTVNVDELDEDNDASIASSGAEFSEPDSAAAAGSRAANAGGIDTDDGNPADAANAGSSSLAANDKGVASADAGGTATGSDPSAAESTAAAVGDDGASAAGSSTAGAG